MLLLTDHITNIVWRPDASGPLLGALVVEDGKATFIHLRTIAPRLALVWSGAARQTVWPLARRHALLTVGPTIAACRAIELEQLWPRDKAAVPTRLVTGLVVVCLNIAAVDKRR